VISSLLILAVGVQISPFAHYNEFKEVKRPLLKIAALQAFKVKSVSRSLAWYSPGYYALQFVYEVDRTKLDTLRKQLPSERFNAVQTNGPAPTMFWRDEPKVKQIAEVPIASGGYSDLTPTDSVTVQEHPIGPGGLKLWPKALLNPNPPLSKKEIYPFPFLRDLTLLSVEMVNRTGTPYSTAFFTSPLSPRSLAEKLEPILKKEWHMFMGRNTIRFAPKGRFKPGPYQIDLQRLVTSGTRVMVVSRGVGATSKG
jgi:hypothetical protein